MEFQLPGAKGGGGKAQKESLQKEIEGILSESENGERQLDETEGEEGELREKKLRSGTSPRTPWKNA